VTTALWITAITSIAIVCNFSTGVAVAQDCTDLYNPNQVLDFYVTMDTLDWEALRFSCPGGLCGARPHSYYHAWFQCEDGTPMEVGIRRKNGLAVPSETDPQKPALKIDINEFLIDQTFMGKRKLSLENGAEDALVTEGLAWLLYGQAGLVSSRVAWANVWVNGEYKGLFANVEQVDKAYLVDHGIDEGGFLFKMDEQRTRENELDPWAFNWYPFDHPQGIPEDPTPEDWRDQAVQRVNMPHLLTLGAVENFVANTDGLFQKGNNYWYYDWSVFPDGQQPRLYLAWDLDTTMLSRSSDLPILGTGTGHLRQGLVVEDLLFQAQYFQIYNDLMAGPLSLASTLAVVDNLETVIGPHMDADPFQQMGASAEEFLRLRNFLQARTGFVTAQLGICPDSTCDAAENSCSCPADCGAAPSTETDCTNAFDDDCDGAVDCADSECVAHPGCVSSPLANEIMISEILANSVDSPDVEYVEIYNAGPGAQDLTGWYLLDNDNLHDKCFLEATLQVGDYLVVPGLTARFASAYPEVNNLNPNEFDSETTGQGFALGDSGDEIRLFKPDPLGDVVVHGYTFGLQGVGIPFGYIPEDADAPEHLAFPTPGSDNTVTVPHSPVCINEFLTTATLGGVDDWIELYNRGSEAVDVGGWSLTDNVGTPQKYVFPAGTVIPAGGFLTVDETTLGFALSSTGSEVIMLTHSDGVTGQDFFDFGPQFADVTQGRFPDGTANWQFFTTPTPGAPNACNPSVPELAHVNELIFSSSSTFSWAQVFDALSYDVVKGDLAALRDTRGDFSLASPDCLQNNVPGNAAFDGDVPLAGEGFFYLVRAADSSCGFGTYDSLSSGLTTSRDEGIAASPNSCP
jgi:hypothetical protein